MKSPAFLIFTFFICTAALAQNARYAKLGDKAYATADYYRAAYYYQMAADKKNNNNSIPFYSDGKTDKEKLQVQQVYVLYRLAESYRLSYNFREADKAYQKVLSSEEARRYPLAGLWDGLCMIAGGNYTGAKLMLEKFRKDFKGEASYLNLADCGIADCRFGMEEDKARLKASVALMNGEWNNDDGNYATIKSGGEYWFTSSRIIAGDKKPRNRVYYLASQNGAPVAINFTNSHASANEQYGTPSVSGDKLYVTGWYKSDGKEHLAIYLSRRENGNWSALQKLNPIVNADGFNAMQPYVTPDGKKLFFVSDRSGGYGGYDIWISNIDGQGQPIDAVNAGNVVNTPFNEESPFFDVVHNRLFFSTNGYPGFGGLDVFSSDEKNEQWSAPVNLGTGINSPGDDLYFYPDPDNNDKFYFSSDRNSQCCLSVFKGHFLERLITGKIIDCDSSVTLAKVQVSAVETATGKNLASVFTNMNGTYQLSVPPGEAVKLVAEKKGYFRKTVSVPDSDDTLNVQQICLLPMKVNTPIVIKNILYDFNSAALRQQSKTALDTIVKMMTDNPGIKIEIRSHTDSIGSDVYNLELSQRRAQACVDYIISKGISPVRLTARGYGESMPIAPNSTPDGSDNPAGRQLNRRTEFVVKE